MNTRFRGAAGLGAVLVSLLLVSVFFALYVVPALSVTGTMTLDRNVYYPESTALITLNDTDADVSIVVTVNSSSNTAGISAVTLYENDSSGVFNGTFTFNSSLSASDDVNHVLAVTHGDTVTVNYNSSEATATATYNETHNGTVIFNETAYGSVGINDTLNVTINDTDLNSSLDGVDNWNVTVNSSSDTTGIVLKIYETGANTALFRGNFSFSTTASNSTTRELLAAEGDNITVLYNDTLDRRGKSIIRINVTRIASTGTLSMDNTSYYPNSTVIINVTDNDLNPNTTDYDTVNVTVNSTSTAAGITVTLNETTSSSGMFIGNFTLGTSSSDANNVLGVSNGVSISVNYTDNINYTGSSTLLNATATYYWRVNATLTLDTTHYGPNSTVVVTAENNDTQANANADPGAYNTVTVTVISNTNVTGLTVVLNETGNNTGLFNGTFTFNTTSQNNSNGILAVSHGDGVYVTYIDEQNASGVWANVTINATFSQNRTGVLSTNATVLNSTYFAYHVNNTAEISLNDADLNNGTGVVDWVNVTVNINNGESIVVNLTETGANTGVFNGTFTFNLTNAATSNDTLDILSVVDGSGVTISYNDTKNASAVQQFINVTVFIDNYAPRISSVISLDTDAIYNPGDTVNINITVDQPGGNISANFSTVDSYYTNYAETVTDNGDGTYKVNYTINNYTIRTEGVKFINITVKDGVGNGPEYYSYYITLSKLFINTTQLDFSTVGAAGSVNQTFMLTNNGTVNQTSMNEIFSIYKRNSFQYTVSQNTSRLFWFIVPENTTHIKFNVTKNITTVNMTVSLKDFNGTQQSSSTSGTISESLGQQGARAWSLRVETTNVTAGGVLVTPVVDVYLNTSQWLRSNFSNGSYLDGSSNTTVTVNLTIPATGILAAVFNGSITYNNSRAGTSYANSSVSLPLTFNVTVSQLWLGSNTSSPMKLIPNGSFIYNANLDRGMQSLNIRVNNTGNQNITGLTAKLLGNFSFVGTNGNITIYPDSGRGGADASTTNASNMSFQDIAPNDNRTLILTFNVTNKTSGIYRTYVVFESAGAQPYNFYNVTVKVNITDRLNVTVMNVSFNNTTPARPRPGNNITINVSVRYQDGAPVTNLTRSNVTFWDNWTTGAIYNRNATTNITGFDLTWNGGGLYIIYYGAPNRSAVGKTEYSMHNFLIDVNATNGNRGNGSGYYNVTAPNIYTYFSDLDSTISNGSTDSFYVVVMNNGTENLTNVIINLSTSGSYTNLSSTQCNIISVLTPGESNSTCQRSVTGSSSSEGTDLLYINVSGTSTDSRTYNGSASQSVTVNIPSSTTTSEDGAGEEAITTFKQSLSIIKYESNVYILLGTSNSTTIIVNNTGNATIKIMLNTTIDSGISVSSTPASCMPMKGKNCTFTITFTTTNSTDIGNHAGTFKAYISDTPTTYDSKSFTVVVTPTEIKKKEINASYSDYEANVTALITEFNQAKAQGMYSEANLTAAENAVNSAKNLLDSLKAAINSGDYITASSLMKQLDTAISNARAKIADLKKEQQAGTQAFWGWLWIWVAVGAVAAVIVSIVVYMLLPTEGFHPERGFTPTVRLGFMGRFKNSIKGLFSKIRSVRRKPSYIKREGYKPIKYTEGYRKMYGYTYEYKRGVGAALKRLFRKLLRRH